MTRQLLFTLGLLALCDCGDAAVHEAPSGASTAIAGLIDDRPAFEQNAPIGNFHYVSPTLYRGGRPSREGLAFLSELGVRTIINMEDYTSMTQSFLREQRRDAAQFGMQVIAIPLSPFLFLDPKDVKQIIAYLDDWSQGTSYVHCRFGLERTGFIIALHRVINEGWSPCAAYTEMRQLGYRPYLVPALTHQYWSWTQAYSDGSTELCSVN